MRQVFTANVSHELKTPLTSISGYAELIENGMAADDDVRRFAKEIHRNSKRLLTLINLKILICMNWQKTVSACFRSMPKNIRYFFLFLEAPAMCAPIRE